MNKTSKLDKKTSNLIEKEKIQIRLQKSREALKKKKSLPKVVAYGPLKIDGVILDAAVLEDGRRIISQKSVFKAFGRPARGNRNVSFFPDTNITIPPFIDSRNLIKSFNAETSELSKVIEYVGENNKMTSGYNAEIIPATCEIYFDLATNRPYDIHFTQKQNVEMALALIKALARTGIVALIDEATGYEKERAAGALAKILEEFLHKELRPYSKVFDVDYYIEMYRVHGHELTLKTAKNGDQYTRTGHFAANFTNDIIYDRLIPGIELRTTLKEKTKGKAYQHQGLKDNKIPFLKEHIKSVTALLKVSDTPDEFNRFMDRAFPKIIEE